MVLTSVYNTLEDQSLINTVQAFVFDTTASHTGRLNGPCVLLEYKFNRDILYLTCRHHIFEIILKSVFIGSTFSSSTGIDILLFKRLKNLCGTIDVTQFFIWSIDAKANIILKNIREKILMFAQTKHRDSLKLLQKLL